MTCRSILAIGFVILALTGVSASDQWPQFRGPDAGAISDDPALPGTWSATENVVDTKRSRSRLSRACAAKVDTFVHIWAVQARLEEFLK